MRIFKPLRRSTDIKNLLDLVLIFIFFCKIDILHELIQHKKHLNDKTRHAFFWKVETQFRIFVFLHIAADASDHPLKAFRSKTSLRDWSNCRARFWLCTNCFHLNNHAFISLKISMRMWLRECPFDSVVNSSTDFNLVAGKFSGRSKLHWSIFGYSVDCKATLCFSWASDTADISVPNFDLVTSKGFFPPSAGRNAVSGNFGVNESAHIVVYSAFFCNWRLLEACRDHALKGAGECCGGSGRPSLTFFIVDVDLKPD